MPECPFYGMNNLSKCRRVSGIGKSVKKARAFFRGEIELTGSTICHVGCNDTRDFLTKRLDSD